MFGIETEYGIHVEGKGAADMVAESRALVRAYGGAFARPWNYEAENPRRDLRGFDVDALSRDQADSQFDAVRAPYQSQSDERADRVLANGARLYNDHGHPEYATPECRDLFDLLAHDRAGERIVLGCARARARDGADVALFKNNTDFHGASYGCHESYLLGRDVPFDELKAALIPFLVTRQVVAGAGKVGMEPAAKGRNPYQLSQRADFISELASVDTLARRPLVNTRDEPHADARRYRRLHVIVGDANMSDTSTMLKVGSTALMLRLLESGWRPTLVLRDPVKAVRDVSRDPSWKWIVELDDHRSMSALDIQRIYAEEAFELQDALPHDLAWTAREWLFTLEALARDPLELADRLDWVAKYTLLDAYRDQEGLAWDDPVLQSLDLAYTNVDPGAGLYRGMEQDGHTARLIDERRIEAAQAHPPEDTRAAVRGALVDRFADRIENLSWGGVAIRVGDERVVLELGILGPEASRAAARAVRAAATLEEAVNALTNSTSQ